MDEQKLNTLLQIIEVIAKVPSTYVDDNRHYMHCCYCSAIQSGEEWLVYEEKFTHEANCIVTMARALMKDIEGYKGEA